MKDGSGRSEQVALADFHDAERAELLVGWLCERLRLQRHERPDATHVA